MKQKTMWVLVIGLLSMTLLSSCLSLNNITDLETVIGSGEVVTEARDVSGFSTVILQGAGDVNIDVTGSESLSITADANYLPYIETVVEGDTLYIRTIREVIFTDVTQLDFNITAANLDAVELQGAGDFNIQNLDTASWQVKLPGAGRITVAGQTGEQSVELLGAGSYEAEDLESQVATIVSSGAGSAVVRVSDELNVTINGLGSVEYIGSPTVNQEINGVGNVTQRQ